MARVRLQSIQKKFGETFAVQALDLDIAEGEFFSLLGPSGCGKTTTLRMIAGFETPDEGRIFFDEADITARPPSKRNTGMVFQNYALFPHFTVFENVAFGLRARKASFPEIKKHVHEALQLVEMADYSERPVTQLSGGQQQRVALARALAIKPRILLLDEPLSNLDAQLRRTTRAELKRLQRRLGITAIYVTHDQEEALALSDRIAVMKNGMLQQLGTPVEIYAAPQNFFVMNFIGASNALPGTVATRTGDTLTIVHEQLRIQCRTSNAARFNAGEAVQFAFRPENARVRSGTPPPSDDSIVLPGKWRTAEFSGTHWLLHFAIAGRACSARMTHEHAVQSLGPDFNNLPLDEAVQIEIAARALAVFPL